MTGDNEDAARGNPAAVATQHDSGRTVQVGPDYPLDDPGLEEHLPRPTDVDDHAAKRAERQIATCFMLSAVFALLFCVAYFVFDVGDNPDIILGYGASNVSLGLCLGLALLLIGVGAIQWARKLMSDVEMGTIRDDIMNEKVLSAIIEIKVPVERAEEIIRLVWDVEKQIDTVVALGVGARCDAEGEENVVAPILERLGYHPQRAKTNIGLGRVTA